SRNHCAPHGWSLDVLFHNPRLEIELLIPQGGRTRRQPRSGNACIRVVSRQSGKSFKKMPVASRQRRKAPPVWKEKEVRGRYGLKETTLRNAQAHVVELVALREARPRSSERNSFCAPEHLGQKGCAAARGARVATRPVLPPETRPDRFIPF